MRFPSFAMVPCIAAILSGALFGGCGYQLAASGRPMGIQMDSLAIPMVTSTSSQKGFEAIFTKIVREEFISRADVPLVPEDSAQAVLTGRINDIITDPLAYDTIERSVGGISTVYRVTNRRRLRIMLDAKLTDRKTGKIIWHEPVMWEQATYDVSVDPLQTQYNHDVALEQAARKLAKKLFLKTVERF